MTSRSATIHCAGHPNIKATHVKTIEFTEDSDVTSAGTCIVGVAAKADRDALLALRGPVMIRLACSGVEDRFRARIDPTFRRGTTLILRRYAKPQPRSLCIAAEKGAAALDRSLIAALQRPGAQLTVTIEETGPAQAQDAALFVVCTPIGEPEDLSPRGRDVLASVDMILAEDTRALNALISREMSAAKTLSYHDHNEAERARQALDRLARGARVALVSDAGSPLVSDPGFRLIAAAHEMGVTVTPVPGPSAVTAALSVAGFSAVDFRFVGFPPRKAQARRAWLSKLATARSVLILFEAEHRLIETLDDLAATMDDRALALCNDLTKPREQVLRGRPSEVRSKIAQIGEPRGEFTLVLDTRPVEIDVGQQQINPSVEQFLRVLVAADVPTKTLARAVTDACGIPRREAFDLVVRLKGRSD